MTYAFFLALIIIIMCYINTNQFGRLPRGKRLKTIKKSKNYKKNLFHNLRMQSPSEIKSVSETQSSSQIQSPNISKLFNAMRSIIQNQKQKIKIPTIKTNFATLKKNENIFIWFGHSSYFIQIDGIKFLIDPVFSKTPSPISLFPKAIPSVDIYQASDMPIIDFLIITHDHWDHFDYPTITKLKFQKIICPLGVGATLEHWNIFNFIEMDWDDEFFIKIENEKMQQNDVKPDIENSVKNDAKVDTVFDEKGKKNEKNTIKNANWKINIVKKEIQHDTKITENIKIEVAGNFGNGNCGQEKSAQKIDKNSICKKDGFTIHCLYSKHFSGRGFLKNKTLWASFLIEMPNDFKIFIGGDGGYDERFSKFGHFFGPIDFAILENGQYNDSWSSIHMHPSQTLKAAMDLCAKALIPVHNSKFFLAPHNWDDPLKSIFDLYLKFEYRFRLITPMIGQKVELRNNRQVFQKWWEEKIEDEEETSCNGENKY